MIRLEAVTKSYPNQRQQRPALSDLSLRIDSGEIIAVVGPNGAGKSTLLGLLSGVLKPTSGSVSGSPRCSVVLQRTALDHLLTVRENAVLFARVYGVPAPERGKRLDEVAKITGLTDRLDERVGSLSGGLARRADLLRAMMVGPELLILDEPAAGLDRESHRAIIDTLDELRRSMGVAIVLSTHDLADAARADRVLLLREGVLVASGAPSELVEGLGYSVVLEPAGDGGEIRCDRDEAQMHAAELLAQGVSYAVRDASLEDVYDGLMGEAR